MKREFEKIVKEVTENGQIEKDLSNWKKEDIMKLMDYLDEKNIDITPNSGKWLITDKKELLKDMIEEGIEKEKAAQILDIKIEKTEKGKIRNEVKRAKELLEEAMEILTKNIEQDYRIDEDILEIIDRDTDDFIYKKVKDSILNKMHERMILSDQKIDEIEDMVFDIIENGWEDEKIIFDMVLENIL